MMQASRSTGNARGTMRPPGIKRSTLFRTRDTRSSSRYLDSRITTGDIVDRGANGGSLMDKGVQVVGVNSRSKVKSKDCERHPKARNITGGYRFGKDGKLETRISENEVTAMGNVQRRKRNEKVLENSESKIHLKSEQVLEDFESFPCRWEWKVDEAGSTRRSSAMTKLRSLRQERTNVFSELTSSLQKMLEAVRHMKNQRSR